MNTTTPAPAVDDTSAAPSAALLDEIARHWPATRDGSCPTGCTDRRRCSRAVLHHARRLQAPMVSGVARQYAVAAIAAPETVVPRRPGELLIEHQIRAVEAILQGGRPAKPRDGGGRR